MAKEGFGVFHERENSITNLYKIQISSHGYRNY
jgi:hypothetical protein